MSWCKKLYNVPKLKRLQRYETGQAEQYPNLITAVLKRKHYYQSGKFMEPFNNQPPIKDK